MKIKNKEKKKWYKEIMKNMKLRDNVSEVKNKFSDFLELPPEVAGNSTKITVIEDTDVLIEGYRQIIDYYDDYIKIKTANIDVIVDGNNLDIKEINDSELVIAGSIYSINYKR